MSHDNHSNEYLLSSNHSLPDDSDSSEKSGSIDHLGNDSLNTSVYSSEKSVFNSKPDITCCSFEVQEKPILCRSSRTLVGLFG